jgi:hypothetical protein
MVQTNAKSRKKALAHLKRAQNLLGFGTFIDLTGSDSDEDPQVVPGSENEPNIVHRSQSASHTSNQSSNAKKRNIPAGLIGKEYVDLKHQQDVEETQADNAFHMRVAKLQQERNQEGWKPADTGPKAVGDSLAHSYMQSVGEPQSALKMIKPIPQRLLHPYQRHPSTGS